MRCLHIGDDHTAIHTRTEQLLKSLRCANGRDLEADAISAYVNTYNISITECNTRLLRKCHRFERGSPSVSYTLYIAGRIDAYDTSSGRIVEIKVRQYGFYYALPPHERIQLFVYMYLRGVTSGVLVEYYGGVAKELAVVQWDQKEWDHYMTDIENRVVATLVDPHPCINAPKARKTPVTLSVNL